MAVNFNDETWLYVKSEIERVIKNQTILCTQQDKTYKEVLYAQGAIAALKTILNLPSTAVWSVNRGNNG